MPVVCLGCPAYDCWLCPACQKKVAPRPTSHCLFCGQKTIIGETCPLCRPERALDGLLSFFPYADDLIQSIIKTWKYRGVKNLTTGIGQMIKDGLLSARKQRYFLQSGDSLLVPVPLHKRRLRQRGFNQSELLAGEISKFLDIPVLGILGRRRATAPQAVLAGQDRQINTLAAFTLLPSARVADKTVILVDDVATTGATLAAAARVLKDGGASSVWAITFAYG